MARQQPSRRKIMKKECASMPCLHPEEVITHIAIAIEVKSKNLDHRAASAALVATTSCNTLITIEDLW